MKIAGQELKQAIEASVRGARPGAVCWCVVPSPLGELLLIGDGSHLRGLWMESQEAWPRKQAEWCWDEAPFRAVRRQLDEYFAGERRVFDLPLAPQGTAFRQRVWAELLRIPYGVTISYGELATRLGDAKASRAVGLANGRNPIAIIVPCHRVIGADGKLTGYAGGIDKKQWLLTWERSATAGESGRALHQLADQISLVE
jgi:methylated-DNA-[protein]-cysteine S-methyltransferase